MNTITQREPRPAVWQRLLTGGLLRLTLVVGLLTAVGMIFTARYGSIALAVAAVRGEALVPDAMTKTFVQAQSDQTYLVEFTLSNVTGTPIRIVGSRSSCTCVLAQDAFPVSVPPLGQTRIKVVVHPRDSKFFRETVRLFTTAPGT